MNLHSHSNIDYMGIEHGRENLVQSAVIFLQNPVVIDTSLGEKQKFLGDKGLSYSEIQIACVKSGAYMLEEKRNIKSSPLLSETVIPLFYDISEPRNASRNTVIAVMRGVAFNVAVIGTVAFTSYLLYRGCRRWIPTL